MTLFHLMIIDRHMREVIGYDLLIQAERADALSRRPPDTPERDGSRSALESVRLLKTILVEYYAQRGE